MDYGYYKNFRLTEEEEQVFAKEGAAEYAYECREAGI